MMRLLPVTRALAAAALPALLAAAAFAEDPEYTSTFHLRDCTFSTTGRNTFMVLEPGYRLVLEGVDDDDVRQRVEIKVLNETVTIGGRELRVIQEREEEDGVLVEVSRSYVAMCHETGGIFYAGEDVDIYVDGEVVSHEGSWRARSGDARAGLLMPGLPILGSRYYQEYAPGVALDRAEVVSLSDTIETPAGRFERCLRTRETTPLEPEAEDFKVYAPGVGLVRDGILKLVSYGFE